MIKTAGGFAMKRLGFALLIMMVWSASAFAAKVYLKDGSVIEARKVWRAKEKVVVLLNKQSIAEFSNSEVNLKKTFVKKKRVVKPATAAATAPAQQGAVAQPGAQPAAQPAKADGKKINLPTLPNKLPEREPPKASEEGTIRKHKKEMAEKTDF